MIRVMPRAEYLQIRDAMHELRSGCRDSAELERDGSTVWDTTSVSFSIPRQIAGEARIALILPWMRFASNPGAFMSFHSDDSDIWVYCCVRGERAPSIEVEQ